MHFFAQVEPGGQGRENESQGSQRPNKTHTGLGSGHQDQETPEENRFGQDAEQDALVRRAGLHHTGHLGRVQVFDFPDLFQPLLERDDPDRLEYKADQEDGKQLEHYKSW